MKKKISLSELKIKSFVTQFNSENKVKGGTSAPPAGTGSLCFSIERGANGQLKCARQLDSDIGIC